MTGQAGERCVWYETVCAVYELLGGRRLVVYGVGTIWSGAWEQAT